MKKNVLCLSDSLDDIRNFIQNAQLLFFPIEQLEPDEHRFSFFEEVYEKLKSSVDLAKVDLIIAEFVEAIPLVYFMRRDGFFAPAIFIPHTNAYPLNLFFYFLLVSHLKHPDDVVLCGSQAAAMGYQKVVNIKALPIATFGIKSRFIRGDKKIARRELGLPEKGKYMLYTGRFMNDKGLAPLLSIYENLKSAHPDLTLLLSISHIDPHCFNQLAPRLKDVIVFYRLENEQMVPLYQSCDLFVSVATSIFETYGKSPLEAIACGVPAVLPRWDGFPHYIHEKNGSLFSIRYGEPNLDAPYCFAHINQEECEAKCRDWLAKENPEISPLPKWAFYDETMLTLSTLVAQFFSSSKSFKERPKKGLLAADLYPPMVAKAK